jgi:hypothetical protein
MQAPNCLFFQVLPFGPFRIFAFGILFSATLPYPAWKKAG